MVLGRIIKGQGLSNSLYDKLVAVLDVFIDVFGGQMTLRGIQTALLLQQSTLNDRGVSISDVRQVTGAPLESIRRHFSKQVDLGVLTSLPDPQDERVVRYRVDDNEQYQRGARRLAALGQIDPEPFEQQSFGSRTYGALLDVLHAFASAMDNGLRIRGIKMAVVIQQAAKSGTGLTASEIARQSGAPLENVRRYIQTYMEMGHLTTIQDPDDSRKTRVLYKDPESVDAVLGTIWMDLQQLDWRQFNLSN
jgi:DNA-binding MarR family transcriptional regulator